MVKKTRRKRSAAKRVKTAKHRSSKRSKRGRGRGRGGRTTKRGGMPLASRVALRNGPPAFVHNVIYGRNPDPREGALAINGIRYFGLPSDIPSPSTKEQAYKEYKEKTNPVELVSVADSVFSAAHKAKYNEQLHAQIEANQTPARTQTHNLFYTPSTQRNLYNDNTGSIIPQPTFSTPFGPSSELSNPPPPDLFVEGKTKPITESPSFKRGFAPTIKNPNPTDPAQRLDFLLGEDDESNKYQTPNSSPYKVSNKSTQKGFDKQKLGHTISSPTRPPFRI